MKILWFGMGGQSYLVDSLRRTIEDNGHQLITIHEYPNADVSWSVENVKKYLNECDVVLLPTDPAQPYKSNNRVIQAMSQGKIVFTDKNIPSYNNIVKNKKNGIVYTHIHEVFTNIKWLNLYPKKRKEIEDNARRTASKYSIDRIGKKYIDVFENVDIRDEVDIIIPYYKNLDYFIKCVESIYQNTNWPYKITVINSSENKLPMSNLYREIFIGERKSFAQAVNIGIKSTNNKYFVIANDDILVSENWLTRMMNTIQHDKTPRLAILNPLSNCDIGFQHNEDLGKFVPNMILDQVSIEDVSDFDKNRKRKMSNNPLQDYTERDWVAFYCTLVVRSAANEIGLLDETFINEFEDKDYCIRAQKLNYKIGTEYSSFVFHYGGKTRKISENLDQDKHKEESNFSVNYGIKKYEKPLFVIFTGVDNGIWDETSIEKGGIGGSETNTICVSREMAKLGYRVKIFNNCKECHFDYKDNNIEYIHHDKFQEWINYNYIDCFLSSRWSYPFQYPIRSKLNLLLAHDVFIKGDKNAVFQNKVNYYLALSNEHRNHLSDYHSISKEKILITANGIDLSRFDKKIKKDPNRMIYSSSLDRGFDVLALNIFPRLKKMYPKMELHVFYGIEGWDQAIQWKKKNNQFQNWEVELYDRVQLGLQQEGVFFHGKIDQNQLAEEFLKASYWFYSTHFEETFCITALEAMAAQCAIVTSNYWGLIDTVKNADVLIDYDRTNRFYNRSDKYQMQFLQKCSKMIEDKEYRNNYLRAGLERVKKFEWKNIANQLDNLIKNNKWNEVQ